MALDIILILAVLFAGLVVYGITQGVRMVPQGQEWVVERFGRYQVTLSPGLSFIIPFFDEVAYRVTTKDIVLDIQRQEVITRDNAIINANAVAFIKVADASAAVYGVVDFQEAVRQLVQTSLRSIIGEMELDEALSSREVIKNRLRDMLAGDVADWGVTLKSVEIQDIEPSQSMQQAMEQQAAAERDRKAMVRRAEGAKQAAILEAEGRFESAKLDAQAEVSLAEGSRKAIQLVSEITGKEDVSLPLHYLLGQRYVNAIKELSLAPGGKFVVLPADLQTAVKGILANKN